MPRNERPAAETLLHTLLDRLEDDRHRIRDITLPIDYTKIGGPAAQDELHQTLHDAQRRGGIALEQSRQGRFTEEYARIRLVDPTALYGFLVRVPASTRATEAIQTVRSAMPDIVADPLFASVVQDAEVAWRNNKSFLDLRPTEIDAFLTVLRLAHGVIHLNGPDIDHRTFSRRTVGDSKALERSEGRVAQILRRGRAELGDHEAREVLEAHGVVRRPHPLFVKGPLDIEAGSMRITGTSNLFLGLPWASLHQSRVAEPVEYVITIENETSFWRYCAEIDGSYLALLTHGFPARDVLAGLQHLVRSALSLRPTPIFHWGDVDAGGVRIAAHLEGAFGVPIHLHDMTADLAARFGSPLASRFGLRRLASNPREIGDLARWLLSSDARALEQEELDPRRPKL